MQIDNETAQQLLQQIRPLVSGDGYNESFENFHLETQFNGMYWRLHPAKTAFNILFKSPDGTIAMKEIKANMISIKDSTHHKKKDEQDEVNIIPDDSLHHISYPSDMPQTAWLKLNAFTYTDYLSFDRKLFKALDKNNIQNLVIDLRNNTGGFVTNAVDLLKYLLQNDFYFDRGNYGFVDTSEFAALCYDKDASRNIDPMIVLSLIEHQSYQFRFLTDSVQSPYKHFFKGNIYLLINNGTFSAASLFAVALKEQSNCKIYGQETGGGLSGCNGGAIRMITLPHSLLQLRLPLFWMNSADSADDKGIGLKPDIEIPISSRDLAYPILRSVINSGIKDNK